MMQPGSSPSKVLGFMVGTGPQSPKAVVCADWERKVEAFDQQEVELHQTQLRLMREQTTTFVRDLSNLEQDMQNMKVQQDATVATLKNQFEAATAEIWNAMKAESKKSDLLTENTLEHINNFERNYATTCQLHDLKMELGKEVQTAIQRPLEKCSENQAALLSLEGKVQELGNMLLNQIDKNDRGHREVQKRLQSQLEQLDCALAETMSTLREHGQVHTKLTDRVDDIHGLHGDLSSKHLDWVEDTKQQIRVSHERADQLEVHLHHHKTSKERLELSITQLETTISKHSLDLTSLRDHVHERHDKHAMDIAGIHDKLQVCSVIEKLQGSVDKHAEMHDIHASFQDTMKSKHQAHSEALEKHMAEAEHFRGRLERHLDSYAKDKRDGESFHKGHHGRLTALEKTHNDLHEHLTSELKYMKASSEKMHSKVSAYESHGATLGKSLGHLCSEKELLATSYNSMRERVCYLEQVAGETTEAVRGMKGAHERFSDTVMKHSKDVETLKGAHARHADVHDRLSHMESQFETHSSVHSGELEALKQHVDKAHSRIFTVEKFHSQIEECRRAHSSHASGVSELHASAAARMEVLENKLNDHADRHKTEHGKLRSLLDKHAIHIDGLKDHSVKQLPSRIEAVEQIIQEVADQSERRKADVMGCLSKMDILLSRIQACEKRSQTEERGAGAGSASLNSLEEQVRTLDVQLHDVHDEFLKEVKRLQESRGMQESKLSSELQSKFDQLQSRISTCESRASEAAEEREVSIKGRIDDLENIIESTKREHADILKKMRERLSAQEVQGGQKLEHVDSIMLELQDIKEDMESRHGEIRGKVEKVEHRLDKHKEEVSKVLTALPDRVDDVEKDVKDLRGDVTELRGKSSSEVAKIAEQVEVERSAREKHLQDLDMQLKSEKASASERVDMLHNSQARHNRILENLSDDLAAVSTKTDHLRRKFSMLKNAWEEDTPRDLAVCQISSPMSMSHPSHSRPEGL